MNTWSGLILAAGKGTRMKSRTPKVLHTILGKPLLSYSVKTLTKLEIKDINVVVSLDNHQAINEAMGNEIKFITQAEPKGTGDAFLSYLDQTDDLADNIIIQNGDMPLISEESITQLIDTHNTQNNLITVLSLNGRAAQDYGRVIRDQTGSVIRIEEAIDSSIKPDEISEVNAGVYCINTKKIKPLIASLKELDTPESYITSIVELGYKQGELIGTSELHSPLEIFGVNDRIQLSNATEILQEQIIITLMSLGVTIYNPDSVYIEDTVCIGSDTTIHPNTILKGNTVVGENSNIGPNSTIIDSEIGDNCEVNASTIEESNIASDCKIGPYCHLRENTILENGVELGDHVEVKNSTLSEAVKAGHFCYIGDAVIGKATNIGAGTITCNYDGESKHPTNIGSNSFIGCDTMLVAPVNIGDNCLTGAGAVVTKDIPSGRRAVGIPARILDNK
ncbi:MAG: bifunctional UDP-N-acetylglucosamine diphosphorylase/glucosamine-1-phosphate N-acetyltransferase GlmU [Dehalococcoidia bacterium]|tara:strand:+ start:3211 stop:4557 length:1347 start_codon:yes stop_codon:yes gene_type:complete